MENKKNELTEQTWLKGLFSGARDAKTLKTANPLLHDAMKDVLKFGKSEGNQIMGLTKKSGVNHVPLNSVDDLLFAIQQGLKPKEYGKLYSGLLKSASTPREILKDISKDLVSSKEFIQKYKGFKSESQLRTELANRKYSQEGIDAIVAETKVNKQFKEAKKINGNKNFNQPVPEPNIGGKLRLSDNSFRRLNSYFNKLGPKTKKALWTILGIGGAIGAYTIFTDMFKDPENPTPDELKKFDFPPCITSLIESGKASYVKNTSGEIIVSFPVTGNNDYDANGGLLFYNNGRVFYKNNKKSGKYTCKGNNMVVTENEDEILTDLTLIKENMNKLVNIEKTRSKSIVNEQSSSEVSLDQMSEYVKTANTKLSMWVTNNELKEVLDIANNLQGKTFQGQDAFQYFMNDFKSVYGKSFYDAVNSVGIKTIGTDGRLYKNKLLQLVNQAGTTSTTSGQIASDGLAGIDIIWDNTNSSTNNGGTVSGGGTNKGDGTAPVKKKSKYRNCSDFPFEYGCRNEHIRDIQMKVKLPERYQTSNFGPITKNKLAELGYTNDMVINGKTMITKALYDKIMGSTVTPTTDQTPDDRVTDTSKSREQQYADMYSVKFEEFKKNYTLQNPNTSYNDILGAFIQQYQDDFDKFVSNPEEYTKGKPNTIFENINEIKDMFKRIL